MSRRLLIVAGAAIAGLMSFAPPLAAQTLDNDKVLIVYGNDACPAGTICVRKGESERFRIPKELRQTAPSAHNERWADRARSFQDVGASGTGSCTSTGQGGWTGCWAKQMRDAKAERQADKDAGSVP